MATMCLHVETCCHVSFRLRGRMHVKLPRPLDRGMEYELLQKNLKIIEQVARRFRDRVNDRRLLHMFLNVPPRVWMRLRDFDPESSE